MHTVLHDRFKQKTLVWWRGHDFQAKLNDKPNEYPQFKTVPTKHSAVNRYKQQNQLDGMQLTEWLQKYDSHLQEKCWLNKRTESQRTL